MESCKNSCSVIQYCKETENGSKDSEISHALNSLESQIIKNETSSTNTLVKSTEDIRDGNFKKENAKGETCVDKTIFSVKNEKVQLDEPSSQGNEFKLIKTEKPSSSDQTTVNEKSTLDINIKSKNIEFSAKEKNPIESVNLEGKKATARNVLDDKLENDGNDDQKVTRGRKRKLSGTAVENELPGASHLEDAEGCDESLDSDLDCNEDMDKPRRRGRKKGKKSSESIPLHLSSDMALGYKMLLKFLETPQFSGFHKPFKRGSGIEEDTKITCLNQIKKKFEDNSYTTIGDFVKDIREMLTNIYETRNPIAIKRALRLEQVLEQRIAQLPNYLRPQCALVLPPDETNNSHNKIRIGKGGGFVSLLLEKTEKQRYEKNKEKRKILAEERKQLKEEQDKDVQEWEKNVLMKNAEEDIKSMWELPAIGHFIHLCADILNIGEVAQFEVERMLLMPQCSDTLDLIMTALLTNSLMRAKLDRTPSMPYNIWSPLVRTRVVSWYRTWHKEGRNEQKLFEEIGIEPEFWQILGPEENPLDYYYFHEISLLQRVWVLKTLCDVDFIRKKTVHDNIRAQTLDDLNPVYLGIDRHGNRYIQLKQFSASDIRIYRQSTSLEGDMTMSEFVENFEGFEPREGPITADKIFRDIWELADKPEIKIRKKKIPKAKKQKCWTSKVVPDSSEKKNLRKSVRAKQKTYVDWSDSDQSDTDLNTLRKKLTFSDPETLYKPLSDKEFISLSVFRLPRDKVTKPASKKSGYIRKTEDSSRNDQVANAEKSSKIELDDNKEDSVKAFGCDDEHSDSLDAKQMQDIQSDFEKTFTADDMNGDDFDLDEKLKNFPLNKDSDNVKFPVKNFEDLKSVFKKEDTLEGFEESSKDSSAVIGDVKTEKKIDSKVKNEDLTYRYNVPDHLKPDSTKFYLVVDSVESLRQLISKFGSHENDLEIITRSTKSQKRKICQNQSSRSCEVELIERLQNLLAELEPWELDFMKSQRANKEKMYKEYTNFINRPPDFVHPNEGYWMKTCEEPATASSVTGTTAVATSATASGDGTPGNGESSGSKEIMANGSDSLDLNQNQDILLPRRRTRVTRLQLQPEDNNDSDDDYDAADDYESNESDDNWVMPTSKRKSKKEASTKTPKLPRRSTGRRAKPASCEKTDSSTNTVEKSVNSSPDKGKKTLFWGPRSSDPSEDLNWEKNRQKILEQHNSPVKKNLSVAEESNSVITEGESRTQVAEKLAASVVATPRRLAPPIPGNKKPYYSSAQLKAMENQAKQGILKEGETAQRRTILVKNPGLVNSGQSPDSGNGTASSVAQELWLVESGNKVPVKLQTYSRSNTSASKHSPQIVARLKQPPLKQIAVPVVTKIGTAAAAVHDPTKFTAQVKTSIQNTANPMSAPKIQNVESIKLASPGTVITQKSGNPVQIQIHQPSGQAVPTRAVVTSVANVRMQQQPLQWQPKVITVQSVDQEGKIVQQQIQTQGQIQIQGQPQVQIQNQSQVQEQQVQQIIHLEPQKWTTVQQPIQITAEKSSAVQQMIVSQSGGVNPDSDLYVTDGKLLMKFDDNFVQQYLTKNKTAQSVNDKIDLKKPLLIVQPKVDSNQGASPIQVQTQPSASPQSNVVVVNKPASALPHNVLPNQVQNILVPANYIIKDNSGGAQAPGHQSIKILQQAPTYIIQQKGVPGKSPQPQIIKIITSQPMATNQGILLSAASLEGGSQVLRPVAQTVVAGDQQSKSPTAIRFLRPLGPSSASSSHAKIHNPIIVNNIVQIQGQDLDPSKGPIAGGKLVGAGGQTVRLASPVQHMVAPSGAAHTVKLSAQPLKTVLNSSQNSGSASLNSPSATSVRVIASGLPQQEQTVIATVSPQGADTMAQTLRVVAPAQPLQPLLSSTGASSVKAGVVVASSPERLPNAGAHAQTVKLLTNSNLSPRLVRQGASGKVTVITAAPSPAQPSEEAPGGTKPSGLSGQAVRLQTVVQSPGSVPSNLPPSSPPVT